MILSSAVSLLHHKEKYNGTRLDIAYITPQLIASAMPSETYLGKYYRMSSAKLIQFLNEKHGENWHVWCLQEDVELGYKPETFGQTDPGKSTGGLVTRFPTPDHRPLPLAKVIKLVTEIRGYVEKDPKNTALIHCRCGKGRTGTVVISYLMLFHGMTYDRAAREFTQKRIRMSVVDGITIKSQQRYLRYLSHWVQTNHFSFFTAPANNIWIVKLIVRSPAIESFELVLDALSAEEENESHERTLWDITFNEKYYVLRPIKQRRPLPADLWMSFVGYRSVLGYTVPQCSINYGFNIDFEPNETVLAQAYPDMPSPLVPSTFSSASSNSSTGSCICKWEDTDGSYGLPLRGVKAFDSIEIFWKRSEEFPASPVEDNLSQPPSIQTLPRDQC